MPLAADVVTSPRKSGRVWDFIMGWTIFCSYRTVMTPRWRASAFFRGSGRLSRGRQLGGRRNTTIRPAAIDGIGK